MDQEIDLKAMSSDDIYALIKEDLYDGMADEVHASVAELLGRGLGPQEILSSALIAGMDVVGEDFRDGILFVPEVLLAARAMKSGMELLRPLLTQSGADQVGRVVLGTVKGDIHDIGKNLVGMMMEGAGFEVFDLGVNTGADKFLAAIEEHKPDIIGMSALLTTTMPYMGVVVEALKENGIRDQIIVMVGGAPLNQDYAEKIGADAYCPDAATAAETAKRLVIQKKTASV